MDIEETSIIGNRMEDGTIKYKCLQKDVGKLPIENLITGSSCYVIDTGDYLIYEATTQQWFAQ